MKLFAKGTLCAALAVNERGLRMAANGGLLRAVGKSITFGIIGALLTGCLGGGGGGGTAAVTTGVFISAGVTMSSTGSGAVANVNNNSHTGTSISNATVTINSMPLTYDAALKIYRGTVAPDNAGNFNLSVTANGTTYTATESAFTSFPAPTLPAPFNTAAANTVSWTPPGGATGNVFYNFVIYGTSGTPLPTVYNPGSVTATSITIPANTTSAGTSYIAMLLGTRLGAQIANAVAGSNFSISSSVQQNFNAQ